MEKLKLNWIHDLSGAICNTNLYADIPTLTISTENVILHDLG